MDADTTKVMQEALQAAVTRLNHNGSGEARAAPIDMMSTLMAFVPKLLQNNAAGGEMLEKLDALQKGDLTSIRGDVEILRKQCFRILKSQEQMLAKVDEMQKQQNTIAQAVLDLAHQMARITFIEDIVADEEVDDDDADDDSEYGINGTRPRHKAARNVDRARP